MTSKNELCFSRGVPEETSNPMTWSTSPAGNFFGRALIECDLDGSRWAERLRLWETQRRRWQGLGGGTYNVNNGFTNGANYDIHSASLVVGHKFATGANEAPSVTHPVTNKRHAIVGWVIQAK